jgi:DNA-directed RNA polymerase specialized sigma24 family protein
MDPNVDPTGYGKLFKLLEPGAPSTEAGFEQCRIKLFKFFAWRRCDDPSNLADETIVRLLRKVNEGEVISSGKPYSYVYGIANKVFFEYCRFQKKQRKASEFPNLPVVLSPIEPNRCQQQCLNRLSLEKRELLEHYFLDNEDSQTIAQKQQITINALRLKIHRIKLELSRCCEECQKNSGC